MAGRGYSALVLLVASVPAGCMADRPPPRAAESVDAVEVERAERGSRPADGQPASEDAAQRGAAPAATTYTTTFDGTELPISENGRWHRTDPNQSPVQTSDGLAYGTQTGTESARHDYNDSNAFLTGFSPNQRASAVIHYTGARIAGNLEVELLLRWSEGGKRTGKWGATTQSGYEINLGQGIYGTFVQIGRWKDANLFDSQVVGSPIRTLGIHHGDVFSAEIIGNQITVRLNDTVIATAVDPIPYPSGGPGIGFYRHDSPGPIDPKSYCFSSFTAEAL
jgi:hypothetical protein